MSSPTAKEYSSFKILNKQGITYCDLRDKQNYINSIFENNATKGYKFPRTLLDEPEDARSEKLSKHKRNYSNNCIRLSYLFNRLSDLKSYRKSKMNQSKEIKEVDVLKLTLEPSTKSSTKVDSIQKSAEVSPRVVLNENKIMDFKTIFDEKRLITPKSKTNNHKVSKPEQPKPSKDVKNSKYNGHLSKLQYHKDILKVTSRVHANGRATEMSRNLSKKLLSTHKPSKSNYIHKNVVTTVGQTNRRGIETKGYIRSISKNPTY